MNILVNPFTVGVLTFIFVINALLLILLVLVQLPKKDAGAGMAFGAGTADALFGAGSGNALTKITKYGTGVFLVLALFLGYLHDKVNAAQHLNDVSLVQKVDQRLAQHPVVAPAPASTPTTPAPANPPSGNSLLLNLPTTTNAPAAK